MSENINNCSKSSIQIWKKCVEKNKILSGKKAFDLNLLKGLPVTEGAFLKL